MLMKTGQICNLSENPSKKSSPFTKGSPNQAAVERGHKAPLRGGFVGRRRNSQEWKLF